LGAKKTKTCFLQAYRGEGKWKGSPLIRWAESEETKLVLGARANARPSPHVFTWKKRKADRTGAGKNREEKMNNTIVLQSRLPQGTKNSNPELDGRDELEKKPKKGKKHSKMEGKKFSAIRGQRAKYWGAGQ